MTHALKAGRHFLTDKDMDFLDDLRKFVRYDFPEDL